MGMPRASSAMGLLQRLNTWVQNQTFLGRIFAQDGSVASPSIMFSNGGIYYNGSAIRFANSGSERFLIGTVIRTGAAANATGYGNNGDVVLPAAGGVRAKNTLKAWANITISGGVPTLVDNFNVSSVTDSGVGLIGVNFTNALTDTNYGVLTGYTDTGDTNAQTVSYASKAVGSVQLRTKNYSSGLTDFNGGQVSVAIAGL